MISDRIARINSITPYYCPDGRICSGRCRFNPCPAGDPWALDWHHADPDKVLRDWINRLNQMTDADLASPKCKPRIRVKAGSRKVATCQKRTPPKRGQAIREASMSRFPRDARTMPR